MSDMNGHFRFVCFSVFDFAAINAEGRDAKVGVWNMQTERENAKEAGNKRAGKTSHSPKGPCRTKNTTA